MPHQDPQRIKKARVFTHKTIPIASVTIAVALALGVGGYKACSKKKGGGGGGQHTAGTPTGLPVITLECGDGFEELPLRRQLTLVVPPDGCWTKVQKRPYEAKCFWIEPLDMVTLEKSYASGKKQSLKNFDPTSEVVDKKKVTGVRFKNNKNHPVTVRITLY